MTVALDCILMSMIERNVTNAYIKMKPKNWLCNNDAAPSKKPDAHKIIFETQGICKATSRIIPKYVVAFKYDLITILGYKQLVYERRMIVYLPFLLPLVICLFCSLCGSQISASRLR